MFRVELGTATTQQKCKDMNSITYHVIGITFTSFLIALTFIVSENVKFKEALEMFREFTSTAVLLASIGVLVRALMSLMFL